MPRGGKRSYKGQVRRFGNPEEIERQIRMQKLEKKESSESDPDSSSEEEESESEEECKKKSPVEHLIEIENPNRTPQRSSKKVSQMEASGVQQPVELSRREREELEKQRAKERYEKLHREGKTDQAKADLARLAIVKKQREEAARKRDELRKNKEVGNRA